MNRDQLKDFSARLNIRLDFRHSRGEWVEGHCPLAPFTHKGGRDESPSFAIRVGNEDNPRSYYKCHSCKHKGSMNKLAIQLALARKDDSLKLVAQEIEILEASGDTSYQLQGFDRARQHQEPKRKKQTFAKWNDRYVPAYWQHEAWNYMQRVRKQPMSLRAMIAMRITFDEYTKRVMFPVWHENGKLAGYSGRLIYKHLEHKKDNPKVRDFQGLDKKSTLLGLRGDVRKMPFNVNGYHGAAHANTIIVVEGLFDVLRLVSAGYHRVKGVMGSELTPEKFAILESYGCPILHLVDPDAAGDAYLHGKIDPLTQEADGHGALKAFSHIVPQFLPNWTDRTDDPGDLSDEKLYDLIENSSLYIAKKPRRR